MDLVLFHSGGSLPDYLECTFKQIRLFNPTINVHFITDKGLMINRLFKKYKILAVDKYECYSKKIDDFALLYGRKHNDFWTITATRLIYIENFLHKNKLQNVYCFENDVLLYYDLSEYHSTFISTYDNLAITPGGDTKAMTGFFFIKNFKSLHLMTQFFIDILSEYGKDVVVDHYGMEMLHEMSLMRAYNKEKGSKYLANLPILPSSVGFELFRTLFDSAAWGQYVGGTKKDGPGAKPADHYVSQVLIKHPEYDVIWKKDNKGRKVPYFKWDGDDIRINNLHIHSKNLSKYTSK